jgi:hypothetical protein
MRKLILVSGLMLCSAIYTLSIAAVLKNIEKREIKKRK